MTALAIAAQLVDELGATIEEWPTDDLGGQALAYACAGWAVIPLHSHDCSCTHGRAPCSTNARSRGKRPLTRRGISDATTDPAQVVEWWSRWPHANIGGRVPAGAFVVDVDPQSDGVDTWATLVAEHGEAATRTAWSGRGDGSRHMYFRHPGGPLNARLGTGIDIKTPAGYTVLPPSKHAATGDRYRWENPAAPIVAAPDWIIALARKKIVTKLPTSTPNRTYVGDSVADWYSSTRSWGELLIRHGWVLVSGDGDSDGSCWRHPTASHAWSATTRHQLLFVYSTNTPFIPTDASAPAGHTRFRAFAVLEHHGDLKAAARAASALRKGAA